MAHKSQSSGFPIRVIYGFVAGFIATLIFHQPVLALLSQLGVAPFGAYNLQATQPFGVPVVLSLAFWGGVWGLLFALSDGLFPEDNGYWIAAFLFGAILTSAVALLIVVPLKGGPVGAGWAPALLLTVLLINGAWGIGTGVVLRLLRGRRAAVT